MSRRAKEWAVKARRNLMEELGNRCVKCGQTEYSLLQFDHKNGQKGYSSRGLSTDQRMCRYRREHKLGLLQILCLFCNSSKGTSLNIYLPTDAELLQAERDAQYSPDDEWVAPGEENDPF